MKHTPGPWITYSKNGLIEVQCKDDTKPPIVSWKGFDDSYRTKKEHLANAHLLDTAPELLETCQALSEAVFAGNWLVDNWGTD